MQPKSNSRPLKIDANDIIWIVSDRIASKIECSVESLFAEFNVDPNSRLAADLISILCDANDYALDWLVAILNSKSIRFSLQQTISVVREIFNDMVDLGRSVSWSPISALGIPPATLALRAKGDPFCLGHVIEKSPTEFFELVERIASGGFVVVYRGVDRHGVSVTVRVQKTDQSRFYQVIARNEAELLARVSIDGIQRNLWSNLPGLRLLSPSHEPVISVSEYVSGVTLREFCKLPHLSSDDLLGVIAKLSDVVENLHREESIHRDIKPDNVLIGRDGKVFLIDFNAACENDPTENTEMIIGSPGYISPEVVACNARVSVQSDVYSLGILARETLCHRKAPSEYISENSSINERLVHGHTDYSTAIRSIVKIATSSHATDRFETAGDFAAACRQAILLPDEPVQLPRRPKLLAYRVGSLLRRIRSLHDHMMLLLFDGLTEEELMQSNGIGGTAKSAIELLSDLGQFSSRLTAIAPSAIAGYIDHLEKLKVNEQFAFIDERESDPFYDEELWEEWFDDMRNKIEKELVNIGELSLEVFHLGYFASSPSCGGFRHAVMLEILQAAGVPKYLECFWLSRERLAEDRAIGGMGIPPSDQEVEANIFSVIDHIACCWCLWGNEFQNNQHNYEVSPYFRPPMTVFVPEKFEESDQSATSSVYSVHNCIPRFPASP